MALTVETGAVVSGADSYVTRADFITYAATIGVTIVSEDATDVLLVKAFEYLNNIEAKLLGTRTLKAQTSAYPRDGLVIEDFSWDSDEIPRQVILAQELLALDLNAGIDIYNRPQSASTPVKSKRVEGAVKIEYAVSDQAKIASQTQTLFVLNSLMKNGGLSVVLSRS